MSTHPYAAAAAACSSSTRPVSGSTSAFRPLFHFNLPPDSESDQEDAPRKITHYDPRIHAPLKAHTPTPTFSSATTLITSIVSTEEDEQKESTNRPLSRRQTNIRTTTAPTATIASLPSDLDPASADTIDSLLSMSSSSSVSSSGSNQSSPRPTPESLSSRLQFAPSLPPRPRDSATMTALNQRSVLPNTPYEREEVVTATVLQPPSPAAATAPPRPPSGKIRKIKPLRRRAIKRKAKLREPVITACELCFQIHDGLYGRGRFCSPVCARQFSIIKRWSNPAAHIRQAKVIQEVEQQ